jgi:hypothetical protein
MNQSAKHTPLPSPWCRLDARLSPLHDGMLPGNNIYPAILSPWGGAAHSLDLV